MGGRLKVALVFEGEIEIGGGFQQQLSVLLRLCGNRDFDFVPVVFTRQNQIMLASMHIESILCKRGVISKIKEKCIEHSVVRFFIHRLPIMGALEKTLYKHSIDICYFLTQSTLSLSLIDMRYILTIFDTSHRDFMEFPEVYEKFQFDNREFMMHRAINKAVAVVVDSQYSKQNIITRYGTSADRVHVCHYSPSINATPSQIPIDIKAKYNIQGEYIYYPAQFWAHKNHIYILEALKILRDRDITLYAIFSGSNRGNLSYISRKIDEFGLHDIVRYIGFAPNEELSSLYMQSLALVMPTYFGPTNIPPLEAFALGVPVVYSNLPDLQEQVGDAALLCNLTNPVSLANHLESLLLNRALRQNLIQRGYERLRSLNRYDIMDIIVPVLHSFAIKQKCWK